MALCVMCPSVPGEDEKCIHSYEDTMMVCVMVDDEAGLNAAAAGNRASMTREEAASMTKALRGAEERYTPLISPYL